MNDPIKKFKTILLEQTLREGGTITKLEANYTDTSISKNRCGICDHFQSPNSCEIVEGFIKPSGWCKYFKAKPLEEKWGKPTKVSPEEKGKYQGKSKEELLKTYNALKARGPHKKGSPEYGRMRELAFAIRAKSGWGKVG